jgi:hypothetical protein
VHRLDEQGGDPAAARGARRHQVERVGQGRFEPAAAAANRCLDHEVGRDERGGRCPDEDEPAESSRRSRSGEERQRHRRHRRHRLDREQLRRRDARREPARAKA